MSQAEKQIHAIVVAAGVGRRLAAGQSKASLLLHGQSLALWSMRAMEACEEISGGTLVVHADDLQEGESWIQKQNDGLEATRKCSGPFWQICLGGKERTDSVRAGLSIAPADSWVLIHDAARPLVQAEDLLSLIQSLEQCSAAILATPVTDSLKLAESKTQPGALTLIERSVTRDQLWAAATPQAFDRQQLLEAFERYEATQQSQDLTDEASLYEALDLDVVLVPCRYPNPKLTYEADLPYFEHSLKLKMLD